MAGVRRLLIPGMVAVSLCISLVGYCGNGSIPLLEVVAPRSPSPPGGAMEVDSLLPTPKLCNCTKRNKTSGDSSGKFVSQETAVEKLVPLPQLKKKINFSRHEGLSLLDHGALNRYYLCAPSTRPGVPAERRRSNHTECKERRFLARNSPIVALASSPGSGNTWLRYLLEQASGVFTGSIYCAHSLKALFPGEHIGMPQKNKHTHLFWIFLISLTPSFSGSLSVTF